jgi:cell division protein FtsI (penicillin-binding protein 3)
MEEYVSALPLSKAGSREKIQSVCEILDLPTNIENFPTVKWVKFKGLSGDKENFAPYMPENGSYIPDVRNMGAADAIRILESNGLRVMISGRGRVVEQTPSQGSICAKGDSVYLTLK